MPLDFDQASDFTKGYRRTVPPEAEGANVQIWRAYVAQMDRVFDLGEMPIITTYFSALFAIYKLTARNTVAQLGVKPPLDGPLIYKEQNRLFDDWKEGREDADINEEVRRDGAYNLDGMIEASEQKLRPGIEATLAAMLSDAWSAFEICVGDLWVNAINRCPAILGDRACASKNASLAEVSGFGYDLRHRLGDFLVETGKYDFLSLKKAQQAYEIAFTFRDGGIADPFQPFDLLEAVGQIRHVYTHRAGIADQRALNALRRLPPLATLEAGQRIPLDGTLVRDSINRTISASIATYIGIEDWFQRNERECQRQIQRRAR